MYYKRKVKHKILKNDELGEHICKNDKIYKYSKGKKKTI